MTFVYTNNELAEREIGKCLPFATALKYQVPRNKLYQEVKNLHNKNFRTWKKISEGDTRQRNSVFHAPGLEGLML